MVQKDPIKEILGFEINLKNFILDPLYGPVGVTDEESEIINTQVFQRLKKIKQLGFASNVYPGATHSRFEHSIGTVYTTWEILKRFLKNYKRQPKWKSSRLLKSFTEDVVRSLRIAALLHDLGHGPFSHALENIARSLGIDFDHDKLSLYLLTFGISPRYVSHVLPKRLHDVIESDKDLSKTLGNYRREVTVIPRNLRIITVAILDEKYQSKSLSKGFLRIRHFLNNLIKGDIGSDRIDYLLRDTYFAGLGHRFNFSDILENIRGIYDRDKDRLLLSIDVKGRHSVEFLLTTRYYHYRLIAHHPQNISEQVKFQKRLEKYVVGSNTHENTIIASFMNVALKEDSVERELPLHIKKIRNVGIWGLEAIRIGWYRYLFYRVIEDLRLRMKYSKIIKSNICEGVKKFVNRKTSLSENDLHIEFTLEKPHIPILQEYWLRYLIRKKLEDEKYSSLIHDHSLLLFGLARAYLSNTSMLVYTDVANYSDVLKYVQKTHNFYINPKIFTETLNDIDLDKMTGHDLLLAALYKLTDEGNWYFKGITKFINSIKSFQAKYCRRKIYDLSNENCYDPEYKTAFVYSPELFNDLLLFDISKLIDIQRKSENVRWRGEKPLYTLVYHLVPTVVGEEVGLEGKTIPLWKALEHYPREFRQNFGI